MNKSTHTAWVLGQASNILEQLPAMVIIFKLLDGDLVFQNSAFLNKLGFSKNDLRELNVHSLFEDSFLDFIKSEETKKSLLQNPSNFDDILLKNQQFSILCNASFRLILHENVEYAFVEMIDKSSVVKYVNEPLDTIDYKEMLTHVQRLQQFGFWTKNLSNPTMYWSNEMYSIMDCEDKDKKITFSDWLQMVEPDDRVFVEEQFNLLKTGELKDSEIIFKLVTPVGSLKWLEMKMTLSESEIGQKKITGIVADITASYVEQEFRNLLTKLGTDFIDIPIDSIEHSIDDMLGQVGNVLHVDRVYIFQFDQEHVLMNNTFEWCADGITAKKENLQNVPIELYRGMLHQNSVADIIHIPDINSLKRNVEMFGHLQAQQIQSFVLVPIKLEDQIVGIVGLDSVRVKRIFTFKEIELMQVLSEIIGNTLQRKSHIEKIQDQDRDFKNLFDTMAQGVVYQDANGQIIQANTAALRLLGLTMQQLLGKDSMDSEWHAVNSEGQPLPGDQHPAMIALKTGQPVYNVEMGIYHPIQKQHIWILVSAMPEFRNGESKPFRVFATFQDITQNKKDAIQLAINEQRLRSIIETQTSYVIRTNLTGSYTYWNKTFEDDFSYVKKLNSENKEAVLASICDYHHQRTIETVQECVAQPGKVVQVELDKPDDDGNIRTTLWEFVCLTDDRGNPTEMQCVGIDVTEQRKATKKLEESEARFKDIFNKNMSPMCLLDPQTGGYIDVNPAFENFYGYTKEQLMNMFIWDINVSNSKDEIYGFLKSIISGNIQTLDLKHKNAKGEVKEIYASFASIVSEGRQIVHEIVIDVTERNQYFRTVELQNKALQDIAWTQSHIVRAPLARLMGIVDQLKELNLEELKDWLSLVESSAHELDLIIQKITSRAQEIKFNKQSDQLN